MKLRIGHDRDFSKEVWKSIWTSWLFYSAIYTAFFGFMLLSRLSDTLSMSLGKIITTAILIIVMYSLLLLISYARQITGKFFFADFPKSRQGKVLFAFLLPCFPVLLGSRRNMLRWAYQHELERDHSMAQARRTARSQLNNEAADNYHFFRQRLSDEEKTFTVRRAEQDLHGAQAELTEREEKVKQAQAAVEEQKKVIEQKQTNYDVIKASDPIIVTAEQIQDEYAKLCRIEGVVSISVYALSAITPMHRLTITIAARKKYNGRLYDLGDFEVHLDPIGCEIHQSRNSRWCNHSVFNNREYALCNSLNYQLSNIVKTQGIVCAVETASATIHTFTNDLLEQLDEAYHYMVVD